MKPVLKIIITAITSILLTMPAPVTGQTYDKEGIYYVDSFLNILKPFIKRDTARLTHLSKFVEFQSQHLSLHDYSFDNQKFWVEQLLQLSRELNNTKNLAIGYYTKGLLFKKKSRYDTVLYYFDSALYFQKKSDHGKDFRKSIYHNTGTVYQILEDYDTALEYYLKALTLSDTTPSRLLIFLYIDISDIYFKAGKNFQKTLEYSKKAIETAQATANKNLYTSTVFNHVEKLLAVKNYEEAAKFLNEIRAHVEKVESFYLHLSFHHFRGKLEFAKGNYEQAEADLLAALKYAKDSKHGMLETDVLNDLCILFFTTGRLKEVKTYAEEHLRISEAYHSRKGLAQALSLLAKYHILQKNDSKALSYQTRFIAIKDSISEEELGKRINLLEMRFQAEKKQKEILQLKEENYKQDEVLKKKSELIFILSVLAFSLSIIFFLGYSVFRNKQKIALQAHQMQEQKIEQLEKDKQLLVADAMIQVQEEERSRFARDLHDGVGGLLSGLKYSISDMKDQFIITGEAISVFERSVKLIDDSIKELRRVAHNMMPETLLKYGLTNALTDFCNSVSNDRTSVNFKIFGVERTIPQPDEVIIYRIVQELISNALKHADAKHISAQMVKGEQWVTISVEDDGIGFDTATLQNNSGAGWSNIQSRVKYLKGKLDIQSSQNKGTFILIELNL
jgi:two-component system, NarL family, sensor kinase